MTRYTRNNCDILCHGEAFATAVDELAAMQILNALRDIETRANAPRVTAPLNLNQCRARREGDEMACACGLRWDVDDAAPPLCAHRAPR